MKKYTLYKTIQLIFFVLVAVGILAWIFPVTSVYNQIAHDPTMKLLAASLWFVLLGSFVFIFLDYSYFFGYLKDYKEMDVAVRSDPMSGIANRFSCDVILEKYLDKPLPKNLGCMMIELTNIQQINKAYGHIQGNLTIRDFSNMLRLSCSGLCFVGRNGGNKFLAIFEDSSPDDMDAFIDRLNLRVSAHNKDSANPPIEFNYGSAYSNLDHVKEITELVSLANSRILHDGDIDDGTEAGAVSSALPDSTSAVAADDVQTNTGAESESKDAVSDTVSAVTDSDKTDSVDIKPDVPASSSVDTEQIDSNSQPSQTEAVSNNADTAVSAADTAVKVTDTASPQAQSSPAVKEESDEF